MSLTYETSSEEEERKGRNGSLPGMVDIQGSVWRILSGGEGRPGPCSEGLHRDMMSENYGNLLSLGEGNFPPEISDTQLLVDCIMGRIY